VDLAYAYPELSKLQKRSLAERIVAIQQLVGTLPAGPGYGYAGSYSDQALHPSWEDVLRADLERSRRRIMTVGSVSTAPVERVASFLPAFADYFAAVPPTPFLDDVTTKNVIVHNGALSGIVDVDWLCFGDPLLTPALTNMALLSRHQQTDYIDDWCDLLDLSPVQQRVLILYTAIFCVGFLSEQGMQFNRDAAPEVDQRGVASLLEILDRLLAELP
jgi:hypothetical protein